MKYIFYSSLIWLIGVLLGLFFLYHFPELIFVEKTKDYIHEELSFSNIVSSNLLVCFINIFGAFTFGILSFINIFYNGFAFSFLLKIIYVIDPIYFLNLLPHSFEVIGFIISASIGFELGLYFYYYVFKNVKRNIDYLKISIKGVVVILIIVVFAFVEVYISTSF